MELFEYWAAVYLGIGALGLVSILVYLTTYIISKHKEKGNDNTGKHRLM